MKFKLLLQGLICCLLLLLAVAIINQFYPINDLITALIGGFGAIAPVILDKLSKDEDKKDSDMRKELEVIRNSLEEIKTIVNENENNIIEIQANLACFSGSKMFEKINNLETEIRIIKENIKK
jgi:hypothetical protein